MSENIILYHFTDEDSAAKILQEGLSKGMIYSDLYHCMIQGVQWLTSDIKLSKHLYKGYRNVRLTIHLNKDDPKLMNYKKWLPKVEKVTSKELIGGYELPCCRKWYLYEGTIPPECISRL